MSDAPIGSKCRSPSGHWNEREIEQLTEMWMRRVPCEEIAGYIGRSPRAVAIKAGRLGLSSRASHQMKIDTKPGSKAKLRNCMCCRKLFYSRGPGNRICLVCKCSEDWNAPQEFVLGGIDTLSR